MLGRYHVDIILWRRPKVCGDFSSINGSNFFRIKNKISQNIPRFIRKSFVDKIYRLKQDKKN